MFVHPATVWPFILTPAIGKSSVLCLLDACTSVLQVGRWEVSSVDSLKKLSFLFQQRTCVFPVLKNLSHACRLREDGESV